ncbi:MAG TPA: DPP IV N-terminal domain-containing protein [Chryseosolibacter sp.]
MTIARGLISAAVFAWSLSQAQSTCENFHPHYSPDNKKIIFYGVRDQVHGIFIADLATGKSELIFDRPYRDAHPTWSPDGASVLFQSQRDSAWFVVDIWKKELATGKLTQLQGFAGVPAYSPDGRTILFQFKPATSEESYEKNKWHIWTMKADGTDQRQLTHGDFNCQVPSFSNDGKQIVFYSDETGNDEIYTMKADGSNHQRLTNHSETDNAPAISPDGKMIAFKSTREGPRELYIMKADGSQVRRLTFGEDSHGAPKWSADGKKILFHSSASGVGRILTLDVATATVEQPMGCNIP